MEPRNICCDPDYFNEDVTIYLATLSEKPYKDMTEDYQELIRDVHAHLGFCEPCKTGYEYLKSELLASEEDIQRSLSEKMLAENERYLNSTL